MMIHDMGSVPVSNVLPSDHNITLSDKDPGGDSGFNFLPIVLTFALAASIREPLL
jgi:hypothetical protein